MSTRPWQSSANQYYAFDGEKHDLLQRISQTPPPTSNRSSRSPLPATHTQISAPTSPIYGSSALSKSSLLDRISPKVYPPNSKPKQEPPPLSPELGDYIDSQLGEEEEEEEQVIRVLDNNQEFVYQRDFGMGGHQDRDDGDSSGSRSSSPAKKRKLVHPNQSASTSTRQSSPSQNKSNLKAKHTRSKSRSPSIPQTNASPIHKTQPPASRLAVDWSSGSSMKGGSQFGKMSGLTFGFAGCRYDTSAEVLTTGDATSQDRIEATPASELPQSDLQDDVQDSRRVEDKTDTHGHTPPSTAAITRDTSENTRELSKEECGISNGGTSLLHRIGSRGPISDPELAVPLKGGEDHDLSHEVSHEEREMTGCDASPVIGPPLTPPSRSEDIRMDSPPPREPPPHTPEHEPPLEDLTQSPLVASSRTPASPPRSDMAHPEGADEEIKTMEQHAEDLLQDIQKEYLSKTEARSARLPTELKETIPRLPGDTPISPRDHDEHPRIPPSPIVDGISPLVGARSISPILDIYHDIASDAMSASAHTPRSTVENLPSSIARSTSDIDSYDTLLEVDPELDQITKQALGDLIVHNLKLSHNLNANDAMRRAIKFEVDQHARDFLKLATTLARRMDMMGEPPEKTAEVSDVEPNQLSSQSILPDTAENGYLEYLPPIEASEVNEEPQLHEEDIQNFPPGEGMEPVPLGVSRSGSEDEVRAEPNDEPAGEQELDIEPTDEHVERVDSVEYVDEDDYQESGLEIPGVWCVRTGRDRTDTIQEHIEVSEVLAARVKKWVKKNGTSGE